MCIYIHIYTYFDLIIQILFYPELCPQGSNHWTFPQKEMCQRWMFFLYPHVIWPFNPLAQALIDMGCVTEKKLVKCPKPSLFSRSARAVAGPSEAKAEVVEPQRVYYEPTLSCCLRLSQVLPNEHNWNLCQPWGSSLAASEWWLERSLTGSVYLLLLRFRKSCSNIQPVDKGSSSADALVVLQCNSAVFGALFFAPKYISGWRCLFNALLLRLLFHSWLFQ